MIVFYAENFQLNLTSTKISLVEENSKFYDYFVKSYSLPFSIKIDESTSIKLGFIDHENSAGYETKYYGNLLIDDVFFNAYFTITDEDDYFLEATLFFGETTLSVLETPLKELPFPVVNVSKLITHAKDVITKSYPEVAYNFPMVIDDTFASKTNYENFKGIVNNYSNGNFLTNYEAFVEDEHVTYNLNVMSPFPYLMAILKTGFDSAGLEMVGSFVSDPASKKILLYTENFLEKFDSNLPEGIQFDTFNEVWSDGVISANKTISLVLEELGTYVFSLFLNLPDTLEVENFVIEKEGEIIFNSTKNNIDEDLILNIESADDLGSVHFTLKLKKITENYNESIGSILEFNKIDLSFPYGSLNIFPTNFSLSEVMPDMTFGAFLNKVKNWLNLEIIFKVGFVSINYIEYNFLNTVFKDERTFEIRKPKRSMNQNQLYKLKTASETISISKSGVGSNDTFRDEDIIEVPIAFGMMKIQEIDNIFTSYKDTETSDFQLLMYDGLQNQLPVAVASVGDKRYTLQEVYELYWSKWLEFRLNSETYKDVFKTDTLEKFDISAGRFKYKKKHLYKKIKRTRIKENQWEIEIESETLP